MRLSYLMFLTSLFGIKKRQAGEVKEQTFFRFCRSKAGDPGVYPFLLLGTFMSLPVTGDDAHRTAGRLSRQLRFEFSHPFA